MPGGGAGVPGPGQAGGRPLAPGRPGRERVVRCRRAADRTQEDLAGAANLHPTYISLPERGERTPTPEVVRRLAAALGRSMADLVAEVEVTSYSRFTRTPSRRNRGRVILTAGGVCPDSALQWWRGLLRVLPAGDPEPGSVSAPSRVTPTR